MKEVIYFSNLQEGTFLKRLLATILSLALILLVLPAGVQAQPAPRILVNGVALTLPADQQPRIENGTTLIPMRAIFEALGATIGWDDPTKTVTGTKGATVVKITLNQPQATVDGKAMPLALPAKLIGSRTYVPLRFVSEALGARVGWDGETATIRITDKRPAVGGNATIAVSRIVPSLLEHAAGTPDRLIRAIYGDGLLRLQADDMELEPALAASMPTVGDDGRTYTFRLRKGIYFHDGTEVTAQDFVYTFGLVTQPTRQFAFNLPQLAPLVESIRATDRYTVVVRTKEPFAPAISWLGLIPPLPSHRLATVPMANLPYHSFWRYPVGAGPFRVQELTSTVLTLGRNPDFWEAKLNPEVGPWLETLRFRATAYEEMGKLFLDGQTDLYEMANAADAGYLRRIPSVTGYPYGRHGHGYFTFNTQVYPTNIPEVRQALSLAFDREYAVNGLMGGQATVAAGPLTGFHWAADPGAKAPFDPARARALLEQAGFTRNSAGMYEKDGRPLTVSLYLGTSSALLEGMGAIAKESWAKIGVQTDLLFMEGNVLLESFLAPGKFQVAFGGFTLGADPYSYFAEVWTTAAMKLDAKGNVTGFNRARYSSAAFDQLVAEMKQTADPVVQAELYRKAAALLLADAPALFVYSNQYVDFVSADLKGVVVRNGYGVGQPEYWYLNEQK